jgi:hypothetical protein
LHDATNTKPNKEGVDSALANSVGKDGGDVYERIDRRRRSLVRDIVKNYREIESALANSVGKSESDIYERIDRRRGALMRDILQK